MSFGSPQEEEQHKQPNLALKKEPENREHGGYTSSKVRRASSSLLEEEGSQVKSRTISFSDGADGQDEDPRAPTRTNTHRRARQQTISGVPLVTRTETIQRLRQTQVEKDYASLVKRDRRLRRFKSWTPKRVVPTAVLAVGLVLFFMRNHVNCWVLYKTSNAWVDSRDMRACVRMYDGWGAGRDELDAGSSDQGNTPLLEQRFDLNDPLSVFLAVVGMIYALMFAEQYADAKGRLNDIRECLTMEGAALHSAILLVRTLEDSVRKADALLLFSAYVEELALSLVDQPNAQQSRSLPKTKRSSGDGKVTPRLLRRNSTEYNISMGTRSIETLYAAIRILNKRRRSSSTEETTVSYDAIVTRVMDVIWTATQARHRRIANTNRRISRFIWVFLVSLGLMNYICILLIQSGSWMLNVMMCLMAIATICMSMLVLADMEQPFDGFVQVDTSVFVLIRRDIRFVMKSENGDDPRSKPQLTMAHSYRNLDARETLSRVEEGIVKRYRPSEGSTNSPLSRFRNVANVARMTTSWMKWQSHTDDEEEEP